MKKYIALGLSVLLLAGCSDATANISDGSTSLLTVNDKEITKQDMYDMMKSSASSSFILNLVQNKILDQEVPVTDEIKAKAQEQLDSSKESMGEYFDQMLKSLYGFSSEEDYLESLINSIRLQELCKTVLADKDIENTYFPRKAKIFTVKDDEKANSALTALQEGQDFKEVCEEYGDTTKYKGEEQLVTSESGLPTLVFDTIKTRTETGLHTEILEDTTNGGYYIIEVTNIDGASLKEEAINTLAATSSVQKSIMNDKYEEYDLSFHDIDVYNTIKKSNPELVD